MKQSVITDAPVNKVSNLSQFCSLKIRRIVQYELNKFLVILNDGFCRSAKSSYCN